MKLNKDVLIGMVTGVAGVMAWWIGLSYGHAVIEQNRTTNCTNVYNSGRDNIRNSQGRAGPASECIGARKVVQVKILPSHPTVIKEDSRAMSKTERVVKPVARPVPLYSGYTIDQLLDAIRFVESSNKQDVRRGRDGEVGPYQIMPRTWFETCKKLRLNWPLHYAKDPVKGRYIAGVFLKSCLDSFEHSPTQVWDGIRAYNKGVRGSRIGRGWNYLRKVREALR